MNVRRSILLWATTLALITLSLTGCSKSDSGPTAPVGGTSFNSETIANGSGFQFVFPTEGHFAYHCAIHPVMQGSVHVVSGGLDTLRVNIANSTASGFQALGANVRPGGRVIWSNISGSNHTVTSD